MEIPYSQKVRNECLNYHYFFQYKKDRTEELKDTTVFEHNKGSIETGYAERVLEELEKEDAKIMKRLSEEQRIRKIMEKEAEEDKRIQRMEYKRRKLAEIQAAQEERELMLKTPKKESRMIEVLNNKVKFVSH